MISGKPDIGQRSQRVSNAQFLNEAKMMIRSELIFRVKSNPDMYPIAFCVCNVKRKKKWRRWDTKMSEGDMARDRGKLLAKTPRITRALLHLKSPQNLVNNNCL